MQPRRQDVLLTPETKPLCAFRESTDGMFVPYAGRILFEYKIDPHLIGTNAGSVQDHNAHFERSLANTSWV